MKRKRTGGLTFNQEEIPSGDCPAGTFSALRLCSGAGPGGAPVVSACPDSLGNIWPEDGSGDGAEGGSCVVLPCTSASGCLFQISGAEQLSIVRNGFFYNIDQGIEPDVVLTQVESFYNREGLVDYLHTIK